MFAIKVKIQLQYKNSTVLKCSSDLTLINDVLDMLPDAEVLFYGVVPLHYCYMYILFIYAYLFFIDSIGINQHLMQTCSKIEATTSFDSNDPVHDECVSFKFYHLIPI